MFYDDISSIHSIFKQLLSHKKKKYFLLHNFPG
jgi:hypothetical protein